MTLSALEFLSIFSNVLKTEVTVSLLLNNYTVFISNLVARDLSLKFDKKMEQLTSIFLGPTPHFYGVIIIFPVEKS